MAIDAKYRELLPSAPEADGEDFGPNARGTWLARTDQTPLGCWHDLGPGVDPATAHSSWTEWRFVIEPSPAFESAAPEAEGVSSSGDREREALTAEDAARWGIDEEMAREPWPRVRMVLAGIIGECDTVADRHLAELAEAADADRRTSPPSPSPTGGEAEGAREWSDEELRAAWIKAGGLPLGMIPGLRRFLAALPSLPSVLARDLERAEEERDTLRALCGEAAGHLCAGQTVSAADMLLAERLEAAAHGRAVASEREHDAAPPAPEAREGDGDV